MGYTAKLLSLLGVRRPSVSVKPVFSESVKRINAEFVGRYLLSPDHFCCLCLKNLTFLISRDISERTYLIHTHISRISPTEGLQKLKVVKRIVKLKPLGVLSILVLFPMSNIEIIVFQISRNGMALEQNEKKNVEREYLMYTSYFLTVRCTVKVILTLCDALWETWKTDVHRTCTRKKMNDIWDSVTIVTHVLHAFYLVVLLCSHSVHLFQTWKRLTV